MSTKYTLISLCELYNKIEIPKIQRDYAQGRTTDDVKNLRDKFVNDFLIKSLIEEKPIELDFVYGSIIFDKKEDEQKKIFIPLDGQQRLTTLFLLHYFIGVKEKRLDEIITHLSKFTYETRPSAHEFCTNLLKQNIVENLQNIKQEIIDSNWFNIDWKKDSTVSGMLNMLDTFANNEELMASHNLFDILIKLDKPLISFYYTDLDEFGLTENLYIRMNARGKMLTNFENFKSEFYKIINYNPELLEQVKDKIEYSWVENLWDYREENTYIIDEPFMSFLKFVTQMIYFKNAEFRAKNYESNFLDFKVLNDIYSKEENLKFLIFSLDIIPKIKKYENIVYWGDFRLKEILNVIITGKPETVDYFILFSALEFLYSKKNEENLFDFIRVVRNLIENTNDKSIREWSRLLESISNLITDENVYEFLSKSNDTNILRGFYSPQIKEEIFKAKLFNLFPQCKNDIFKMEDNSFLGGNITNLLVSTFSKNEDDFKNNNLENIEYDAEKLITLNNIFEAYEKIAIDNFDSIWGNLLNTQIYKYDTTYSRVDYSIDFAKHPSIFIFSKDFYEFSPKLLVDEFIKNTQKRFVNDLRNKFEDFSEIRNPKHQIYLYYIIHQRIYNKDFKTFFKNGNYNFGWLEKETGFTSLFKKGIDECQYFPEKNPIFQVYNQQFRYNLGLKKYNALNEEIVGIGNKREPFKLIIDWAKS